ncbi:aminotransferase class V-fold PLP-dependent enzyme [Streptomyces sp. NPDC051985]|uniref:aminotransferase class V-fold PLP-dependent enzyme n=1 Tax=Streptomyces sp. NPDC051985 TaxID=3155807 RepID=UPI0034400F73
MAEVHAIVAADEFPGLVDQIYLNSAGIGLVPVSVQDVAVDFARAVGATGTQAYFDRYAQLMVEPRQAAARLYGARPDTIAIITSVSEAISQLAWWRRPRRGENVVLIDNDCSATTYPWLRVAQDTGAEIRFVKSDPEFGTVDIAEIERLVDRHTAAVCLSHVHWETGQRFDLLRLSALARAHGALFVVDAMHSTGVLSFTQSELDGIDLMVAGSFKWLCGYAGAGVAYLNPLIIPEFQPILVGSRTGDPEPPFDGIDATRIRLPDDARRLEYGSSVAVPRVAFSAAAKFATDLGIDTITAHVQALGSRLIKGLNTLDGRVVTPENPVERAGIVSVTFPGRDMRKIYRALLGEGVATLLRANNIRFSPHHFNGERDIDGAVEALARCLGT